jgi:hypothetical protein
MNGSFFRRGALALLIVGGILNQAVWGALIPRGNGMVYDDFMRVTWLQDANYASTTGFAPGGFMIWSTANDWAQSNVTVGGFTDWRLPSTAEFQNMFMETNGLGNLEPGMTNSGPFTNLVFGTSLDGYWATNFFMLATPDGLTPEYYVYNYMLLGWTYQVDGGGANFAWPVRSGDIAHPTNTIAVTVFPAGAGSVSGSGSYPASFATTLQATSNTGFRFQNWTENGVVVSSASNYAFVATNDVALVANFSVDQIPSLQFGAVATGDFILSWPTNFAGFTLQQSVTLTATNWQAALESVGIAGANYQATISTTNGLRYFQLTRP